MGVPQMDGTPILGNVHIKPKQILSQLSSDMENPSNCLQSSPKAKSVEVIDPQKIIQNYAFSECECVPTN